MPSKFGLAPTSQTQSLLTGKHPDRHDEVWTALDVWESGSRKPNELGRSHTRDVDLKVINPEPMSPSAWPERSPERFDHRHHRRPDPSLVVNGVDHGG
jgi:hypothetical protein